MLTLSMMHALMSAFDPKQTIEVADNSRGASQTKARRKAPAKR